MAAELAGGGQVDVQYSRTAGQVGFIAQRGSEVKGWAGGAASHSRGIGIIPALASLLTHWMSALM